MEPEMIEDVNDATYHDTGGNGIDDTAGLDTDGDGYEYEWTTPSIDRRTAR
jgi:hypothetical protein